MYAAHFGFRTLPFNGVPDPRGPFASAAFRDAHAALWQAIQQGQRLIVLTGATGAGKTTLLRQLRAVLEPSGFEPFTLDAGCDAESLLDSVRACLCTMACQQEQAGPAGGQSGPRGFVIFVDQAHALPDQALASLLRLFTRRETGAWPKVVVLLGLPGLELRLERPGLLARGLGTPVCCSLAGLDAHEVGAYIRRKLEAVGHAGAGLFSADAVRAIAWHSGGIPRRIDTLCGMALLIACESGRRAVDEAMVAEVVHDLDDDAEPAPRPCAQAAAGAPPLPVDAGLDERAVAGMASDRRALAPLRRVAQAARRRMAAAMAASGVATRAMASAWLGRWRRLRMGRSRQRARLGDASYRIPYLPRRDVPRGLRFAPGGDWLALKIALVGAPVAGVLIAVAMLVNPLAPTEAGHTPVASWLEGAQAQEAAQSGATGSSEQERQQQTALLGHQERYLRESLAQALGKLGRKDELIDQQRASLEELKNRLAAAEAELASVRDSRKQVAWARAGGPVSGVTTAGMERDRDGSQDRIMKAALAVELSRSAAADAGVRAAAPTAGVRAVGAVREQPATPAMQLVEVSAISLPGSRAGARLAPAGEPVTRRPGGVDGTKSLPVTDGLHVNRARPTPAPGPIAAPRKDTAVAPGTTSGAATDTHEAGANEPRTNGGFVYKVRAGDTLFAVSRRFNVTVPELREWNGIAGDRLSIGQAIRVSPDGRPAPALLQAPLLDAADRGQLAVVARLLDAGAFADAGDAQGESALMRAASHGHVEVVGLLAARGADVNVRSKSGATALSHAARNGDLPTLSELLRRGARVDLKDRDGWTALMHAAANGHVRCVESLLEAGAQVNTKNNQRRTALFAAVWNGHEEVARALLQGGANVEERSHDGWTVLMEAAWNGQTELVKLLLEFGADPVAKSDAGVTPRQVAEQLGHGEILAAIAN